MPIPDVALPRPLREEERAVLDLLLEADFPGAEALRAQARTVIVTRGCTCPCPSIAFEVEAGAPPGISTSSGLAPVEGRVRDGQGDSPGEIIVFLERGFLSYLEYVYYGDAPPTWPPVHQIDVVT